jgi:hypothetical protein
MGPLGANSEDTIRFSFRRFCLPERFCGPLA